MSTRLGRLARRWGWRGISVRGMLVLVLVAGLIMGRTVNRARTQEWAVEAIEAQQGTVFFDYQMSEKSGGPILLTSHYEPEAPAWLRDRVGDAYFRDVIAVQFTGTGTSYRSDGAPETVKYLRGLPALRQVMLGPNTAIDANMAELARNRRLERVTMRFGEEISDSGIAELARLRSLKRLTLQRSEVGDEGLAHLARLPRIEELNLKANRITDDGLAHLAGAKRLRKLAIGAFLGKGSDAITDAGLVHLLGLTALEELELSETQITDDGLALLERLPNLKKVNLRSTNTTDAGAAQLRAILDARQVSDKSGRVP